VEKGSGENKEVIADLSAPFVTGAAIVAPHLAFASVALMFISGYRVRIKRIKGEKAVPESVETFVDQTVSNIKRTASSLSDTMRSGRCDNPFQNDDDDDEGGEITVE
jgi:uncharacterized spore protein YtfJ